MSILPFKSSDLPHDLQHLRCLSVKKAADILDFDEKTIRRMATDGSGDLEGVGRGHRFRITVRSVEAYIERERR